MTKRKIIGLSAILAVVLLMGLTACSPQDLQAYQGMLKNVDSLSGNVTVTLNDGTTKTFNLADIDQQALKDTLGNLNIEIGDNVTIKQDNHGSIRKMEVHAGEAEGVIKSLGTDNITLTTEENGEVTLQVTANTLIIEKATGTIAFTDLAVGQQVEARYDNSNMQATKLKINYENTWQDNGENQDQEQNQEHGQSQNHQQNRGHAAEGDGKGED
jgi:hypothetical protein